MAFHLTRALRPALSQSALVRLSRPLRCQALLQLRSSGGVLRSDRSFATTASSGQEQEQPESNFLGIVGSKSEQIEAKLSNVDRSGIWDSLPKSLRRSLSDPDRGEFLQWLGHGVTPGKAGIVKLFTAEEADGIIGCMETDGSAPGVMSAEKTSELYLGRVNTARHLVCDAQLAECIHKRLLHCRLEDGGRFLDAMDHGSAVVGVGDKIRLVTTAEGGSHQKHADISEPSEDGSKVSRLTFQCYLNPEAYKGGEFQVYPGNGNLAVDVPMAKGCAVVFVQEDAEVMHGGAAVVAGGPKRAVRGNLEVVA